MSNLLLPLTVNSIASIFYQNKISLPLTSPSASEMYLIYRGWEWSQCWSLRKINFCLTKVWLAGVLEGWLGQVTGRWFARQWSEIIFIFCREYSSLACLARSVRTSSAVSQHGGCLSPERWSGERWEVRGERDQPGYHGGLTAADQPPRHLGPGPGCQPTVRSDGLWGAVYWHLQTEGLPVRLVPQETQLEWNISK